MRADIVKHLPLDHHRRRWHLASGSVIVVVLYCATILATTIWLQR